MRIWVMLIVSAIAVSGLNKAYTAWRADPPRAMTELRGKCIAKASAFGLPSSVGFDLCNCMVDKASAWKRTYPGAEYSREAHLQLGKECLAALPASTSSEFSSAVFESDPETVRDSGFAPEYASGQSPEAESDPETGSEERYSRSQPKQFGDPGYGTD